MVSLPHPGSSAAPLLLFLLSEADTDTDKFVCIRVDDGPNPDGLPQTLSSFAA